MCAGLTLAYKKDLVHVHSDTVEYVTDRTILGESWPVQAFTNKQGAHHVSVTTQHQGVHAGRAFEVLTVTHGNVGVGGDKHAEDTFFPGYQWHV